MPSIGLAAGARIAQAAGLPLPPAPGACRAALQNCAGHGARFFHAAAARAGARRFNRARAHIPVIDHASPGGRPRAPHAAVPSAALHLPGHFANCHAENFGFTERGETTGSKTMFSISRLYARSGFLRFF